MDDRRRAEWARIEHALRDDSETDSMSVDAGGTKEAAGAIAQRVARVTAHRLRSAFVAMNDRDSRCDSFGYGKSITSPSPAGAVASVTRWETRAVPRTKSRHKRDTSRRFASRIAALVVLGVMASATNALGQDATALAARRELIDQSQRERSSGNHAAALDRASRAGRIQMTPSLRLFIAQEHNSLGQLADAYGEASRCAADADADQALANRATIVASCRALATSLHDRIGRITITASDPRPDLAVTLGGHRLDETLLGVPYPVTPGNVVITATAAGFEPYRREISVAPNQSAELRIEMQRTPQASPAAAPSATVVAEPPHPISEPTTSTTTTTQRVDTPASPNAAQSEPRAVAPARSAGSPSRFTGPWIVGGGGVVLLAISGILFGAYKVALEECPSYPCMSQSDADLINRTSIGGFITLGAGVIAVAGGIAWGFLHDTPAPHSTSPRARAWITPLPAGVAVGVGGSF